MFMTVLWGKKGKLHLLVRSLQCSMLSRKACRAYKQSSTVQTHLPATQSSVGKSHTPSPIPVNFESLRSQVLQVLWRVGPVIGNLTLVPPPTNVCSTSPKLFSLAE